MPEKSDSFRNKVASLLAQVDYHNHFKIHPLSDGANNQVYLIDANGGQICLKAYFQHPDDPRDRLNTEFSFLQYCLNAGIKVVPEPIACDKKNGLALYEFIPGQKVQPGRVNRDMVQRALDFFYALNRHKYEPDAVKLPGASESCFSISGHIQTVNNRVNRLLAIENSTPVNQEAINFVQSHLSKMWWRVMESTFRTAEQLNIRSNEEIPHSDWCLSQSDFGFHNAISGTDGQLYFIDFEYAGWDDPDRMVCDFFCQPAVPVPVEFFEMFATGVTAKLSSSEKHIHRIKILMPIYQIKWCCILLNEFLPTGSERRRFARAQIVQEERKAQQLQKARAYLKQIRESYCFNEFETLASY